MCVPGCASSGSGPVGADEARIAVLRLELPRAMVVRVQGALEGEDGLGVLRGGGDGRPEIWTPAARAEEVRRWVEGLPRTWQVRLIDIAWLDEAGEDRQ